MIAWISYFLIHLIYSRSERASFLGFIAELLIFLSIIMNINSESKFFLAIEFYWNFLIIYFELFIKCQGCLCLNFSIYSIDLLYENFCLIHLVFYLFYNSKYSTNYDWTNFYFFSFGRQIFVFTNPLIDFILKFYLAH